ncbi:MAG: hypothetical protein CO141_03165 [Candidatus Moranbacteria bacterium CG_4_9_14_3_um_filter_42_9]|nr:MAG: hypothetical protein CO141_03165 [Candidatus Moranbacteria bacterium CG_4_9_14_3_um_filter_42_9]
MKASDHNRIAGRKKDWFSSLIAWLLIGTMVFYQLLPFSVAVAQEVSTEPATEVVTITPAAEDTSDDTSADDTSEDDASSTGDSSSAGTSSDDGATGATGATDDTTAGTAADTAADTGIPAEAASTETLAAPEDSLTQTSSPAGSEDPVSCACPADTSGTENTDPEAPSSPCPETCPEVTVENTNDATAQNDVTATADTGNNAIGEPVADPTLQTETVATEPESINPENASLTEENPAPGGRDNSTETNTSPADTPADESNSETPADPAAVIETGEALAVADVVNEVNINIITDNGANSTQNITGDYTGDVNLLDTFYTLLDSAQTLNEGNQSALGALNIINDNSAVITNNVVVDANSGNNTIETGSDGYESDQSGAEIQTGDATAIANVVNLANLNIVGNNWLFAVVNVFGNWVGNLVVPGAGLLTLPGSVCGNGCLGNPTEVSNSNSADIQNNVGAVASTGENSISSSGDATIETGDAYAGTNVKNIVNTNIVDNNWFFLVVNNMGSWMGSVLNWNAETGEMENVYSYDFGTDGNNLTSSGTLTVENRNSATIVNNVETSANTGGNNINGEGGEATIQTGNASAVSRVVNFINTNIVGNNWMFGIVNIFGSWKGDVEFAYPDLAVSLSGDKNTVMPGDELTYTIRYKNNGKAKADDAGLMLSLPDQVAYQSDSSGAAVNGQDLAWSFSGLNPGEEKAVRVVVAVDPNIPETVESLQSVVGTRTSTKEPETGNNSASVSTGVVFPEEPQITIFDGESNSLNSELKIKRTDDAGPVSSGSIINHAITVKNPSKHTLYNIEVKEKIQDPNGAKMVEYVWTIDKLKKGQGALIEYQVAVNESIQPGLYEHTASAEALDAAGDKVESRKVTAGIEVFLAAIWNGVGEEIVPTASAAETVEPGKVLGDETMRLLTLPIWIWMLAAAAYYLTLNWSIFPKRRQ